MSSIKPLIELSNGERMPVVGLGTWGMFDEELRSAVCTALEVGYRHLDAAFFHGNEETIGVALNEWMENKKVTRSDLFITSKIADIWKEMENLVEEGHVKNIGVCNFNLEQLEKLLSVSTIKPAVLQIELHAYWQQKEIREFCKEHKIAVTGFCPLGSPGRDDMFLNGSKLCLSLMQEPVVTKIAEKCDKTPAQILLRHALQNGIVVVPKSATPSRIKGNFEIFNFFLTPNEMKCLNMLDKGQYARSFNYSFLGEAFLSHPDFPFEGQPVDEPVSHH